MSRKNNFANFIAVILSVLLFFGAVAFVIKFTNGFNEEFKSFYLEYDGQKILTANSNLSLEEDKEHKFLCKYLVEPKDKSFSVKIVVNDDVNFNYTVAGENYSFRDIKDLSSYFKVKIDDGYFTVLVPKNCSLLNVLKQVHNSDDIVIIDDVSNYNSFYTFVVSNFNSTITYNIDIDTFIVS